MATTTYRGLWRGRGGVVLFTSTLLVASMLLVTPVHSAAAALKCGGKKVTITGTNGADVIKGTSNADVIHALGGNDIVKGSDGNDTVCGGSGSDELHGGNGDDVLLGGGQADRLVGDKGNDVLNGGNGADTLLGGNGNDKLIGGKGGDEANGGKGADVVKGGGGNDTLVGGPQADVVNGGAGTDRCAGETETNCEAKAIDFNIKRFLINQAVPAADSKQRASKRVATVAGRGGVVRVFLAANQKGIDAPLVTLHVRKQNGSVSRYPLSGPAKVPTKPKVAALNSSYNFVFDKTFLKPGMKMYVTVDRNNAVFEVSEKNNRYPAKGFANIKSLKVPTMKITVVRAQGMSLTRSEAIALFRKTFQVHPVADWDIEMRPGNYTCQACTGGISADNFITLLQETGDLAAADPEGRMYHTILPLAWGQQTGIGGIGFVGFPASVSVPIDETIAHETGHNLDLSHVLCSGQEGSPDMNYPHAGGSIGNWGYNPATGKTYDPGVWKDLMTYCSNEWIGDYSYQRALDHRMAVGYDVIGTGLATAGAGRVVHFAGTVPADAAARASLEAAPQSERLDVASPTEIKSVRVVDGAPAAPRPGDHTLVGRDSAGAVVMTVSFRAYAYDHAPGAYFTFSVELADATLDRVAEWQIEKAGTVLASRRAL